MHFSTMVTKTYMLQVCCLATVLPLPMTTEGTRLLQRGGHHMWHYGAVRGSDSALRRRSRDTTLSNRGGRRGRLYHCLGDPCLKIQKGIKS